jgi:hypothetical protein
VPIRARVRYPGILIRVRARCPPVGTDWWAEARCERARCPLDPQSWALPSHLHCPSSSIRSLSCSVLYGVPVRCPYSPAGKPKCHNVHLPLCVGPARGGLVVVVLPAASSLSTAGPARAAGRRGGRHRRRLPRSLGCDASWWRCWVSSGDLTLHDTACRRLTARWGGRVHPGC